MSRRVRPLWAVLTVAALVATGCRPAHPLYLWDDGDLSHYVGMATNLSTPDVETESLADVTEAQSPLTLENPKPKEMWPLSLEEAVSTSLNNAKVLRSLGARFVSSAFNQRSQTGEAPDAVLTGPDRVQTIYDPAITETTPFVGVEYAMSSFDPVLSGNFNWLQNHRPQNVNATGPFGNFFAPILREESATYQAQLSKVTAGGDTFTMRNNVIFDQNNNPTRQTNGDYNVNVEASFSHPFLSGSGVQFNRIAGPFNPFTGVGTPGFDGVVLARINTDISLADFEAGVRNLVSDVENAYWELYFAYRNLDATKKGRESALKTWQKVHALYMVGAKGGEAEKEAQAREQYFLFHGQVQTALNDIYRAENRLRYMMGLAVSDGRLILPSDEPTTAKVTFDWQDIHEEGLARSIELRRQKWRIKERELELIAARNLLQPRLDATGTYRWLGLGESLAGDEVKPNPVAIKGTNALQSLGSGTFQEWSLGAVFSMPLGFRKELDTVRHFELQIARERARLQDQELEVSHEIGDALRNLEYNYDLTQTNFNRRMAAEQQVKAVAAAYETGTVTLDLLLEAQRRLADAESAYYRTLVDYNRGVAQVHFRKGSLLEYNGVFLSEGPWPAKARFDAERLAHQRDASFYLDYGYTRPRVVSQGPVPQHRPDEVLDAEQDTHWLEDAAPAAAAPEEIPAPTPRERGRSGSSPDVNDPARGSTPASVLRTRTTQAEPKSGFDWGSLGMAEAEGQRSLQQKASDASGEPAVASDSPQERGAAKSSRLRQPSAGFAERPRTNAPQKALSAPEVQQAGFQDWKPAGQRAPHAEESSDSSDPQTGGWKAIQR